MAKKKKEPKKKAPKPARKAKPPNTKRRRGNRPAGPKGPRSQTFQGMEQVRNPKLDGLCEDIGDGRDTINTTKGEEKAAQRVALKEMHDRGLTVYKHAGVTLMRVPGEEKLVVKTTKGADATGRSDESEAETPEPAAAPPPAPMTSAAPDPVDPQSASKLPDDNTF